MKRKIFLYILLISSMFLTSQPSQATNTIVNAALTYDERSYSQSVYLEADNYTITITSEGDIVENSGRTEWLLKKDSMILLAYASELDYKTETYRLTIHETANYLLMFNLDPNEFNPSAFMNYEIIIVELALVIHPKTEIISEAPYGIGIIFIALISVAIIKLGKRRDYSEI